MKCEINDVENKVDNYLQELQVHHYCNIEIGRKMVEIHINNIYCYNKEKDVHLPPLLPIGGSLSICCTQGKEIHITFGQDKAISWSLQVKKNCWIID